jgi:hypothetical protein
MSINDWYPDCVVRFEIDNKCYLERSCSLRKPNQQSRFQYTSMSMLDDNCYFCLSRRPNSWKSTSRLLIHCRCKNMREFNEHFFFVCIARWCLASCFTSEICNWLDVFALEHVSTAVIWTSSWLILPHPQPQAGKNFKEFFAIYFLKYSKLFPFQRHTKLRLIDLTLEFLLAAI